MAELSAAQLEANRANAQKSTGPKTPEGKAKSALNGLVHGLRAETVVLPGEDADLYEAFRLALHDEHKPQTFTEIHLVDKMAAARWAMERAQRQETAALAARTLAAVEQCDLDDPEAVRLAYNLASFDDSKEGVLRLRYIIAQDNIFNRALRGLMALRRQRQREEKAVETARRRQEREAQAALKRPAPTEPKPGKPLLPPPPPEFLVPTRPAPAYSEIPVFATPQPAPTAPPRRC